MRRKMIITVWCVSEERLEYIFQSAQEMGIQFYTYKELQKD